MDFNIKNVSVKKETGKRERFRRFILVLSFSGIIGIMAMLILWDSIFLGIDIKCPFKLLLDIDCPGCGITRMCKSILNGDFYQAFRYNVYIYSTLPILAFVYVWQAYMYIIHNKLLKYIDIFLVLYVIFTISFGIIRNIDIFRFLSPTNI